MEYMWKRDKGHLLKQHSIDRIDNDGNYELNNCKFIEIGINSNKDKIFPKIAQYDKNHNLIKIWDSQGQIARELGVSQGDISNCVNSAKLKTCNGFIWKKLKEK